MKKIISASKNVRNRDAHGAYCCIGIVWAWDYTDSGASF